MRRDILRSESGVKYVVHATTSKYNISYMR
jgi:hypothetical protein